MKLEERILLEENELKPNRYVANTMAFAMLVALFVELLNELRVFHVNFVSMRVCCAILLACCLAIQVLGRSERFAAKSGTKYRILFLVYVNILVITVMLFQWSELLIVLPLLLAIQYHDRQITKILPHRRGDRGAAHASAEHPVRLCAAGLLSLPDSERRL